MTDTNEQQPRPIESANDPRPISKKITCKVCVIERRPDGTEFVLPGSETEFEIPPGEKVIVAEEQAR
jgi:hypothetical protein